MRTVGGQESWHYEYTALGAQLLYVVRNAKVRGKEIFFGSDCTMWIPRLGK